VIEKQDEELRENAEVKLSVTVAAPEVQRVYDATVAEHCRTARIKGFRKGKVPRDVLIRKAGDALLAEAAERIIGEAAQQALEAAEHPPIRSSRPRVEAEEPLAIGSAFRFDLQYDTKPEVSLGRYQGVGVTRHRFRIDDADLQRELDAVRDQNAVVVEKQSDVVESGDVVEIDYVEVENGRPVASTRRDGFVFEVGTGYNQHRIDDDLVGMQVDEERDIDKTYPDDFEEESLAGRSLVLRVRVRRLREKQLPELDDELAQDVSERFETLEDLKADIRERLRSNGDRIVRERLISAIITAVEESSVVPLPGSLVDAGLAADWSALVSRNGGSERRVTLALQQSGTDRDALIEQWRPAAERRTRLMLITDRLAEVEEIAVGDDEVEQELARRAQARSTEVEELRGAYESNDLMPSLRADLRNEKLYDRLIELAAIKDGDELSYVDLVSGKG
jgi:trigger factor